MSTPATESPRALPALLIGALAIGLSPIFVRLVDVGYTASAFWRLALAIPVLLLFLLAQRSFIEGISTSGVKG